MLFSHQNKMIVIATERSRPEVRVSFTGRSTEDPDFRNTVMQHMCYKSVQIRI